MTPGGGLVVEGPGLQASVQDADEAVREPAERVAVLKSFGALLVVEGARAGGIYGSEGSGPGRASSPRRWPQARGVLPDRPCVAAIDTSDEVAAPVFAADHALGRQLHQDEPDRRASGVQLLRELPF